MAHVSNFTFHNLSRPSEDSGCLDQATIQNAQACTYTLQNYFAHDGAMNKARALAVTQPCINYRGSFGLGLGNVEESSNLLIGGIQTQPKTKIDLFGRPFATVPFLGRGAVDPILESQIQQGEGVTNKRTITRLGEKSYLKYHTIPLIPEVKEKIQNPSLMIESMANEGWVRGGMASREMTRDFGGN